MDPYGGLPADLNMGMSGMAPPAAPDPSSQDPFQAEIAKIQVSLNIIVSADGSVDEEERLKVQKIMTAIQDLVTGRFKEQQAMLGGGPATQGLARIFGGR